MKSLLVLSLALFVCLMKAREVESELVSSQNHLDMDRKMEEIQELQLDDGLNGVTVAKLGLFEEYGTDEGVRLVAEKSPRNPDLLPEIQDTTGFASRPPGRGEPSSTRVAGLMGSLPAEPVVAGMSAENPPFVVSDKKQSRPCTADDFECAFNHYRTANGSCLLVPGLEPLFTNTTTSTNCTSGHGASCAPSAYRKLPSSTCQGVLQLDQETPQLLPFPPPREQFDLELKDLPVVLGIVFGLIFLVVMLDVGFVWMYRRTPSMGITAFVLNATRNIKRSLSNAFTVTGYGLVAIPRFFGRVGRTIWAGVEWPFRKKSTIALDVEAEERLIDQAGYRDDIEVESPPQVSRTENGA